MTQQDIKEPWHSMYVISSPAGTDAGLMTRENMYVIKLLPFPQKLRYVSQDARRFVKMQQWTFLAYVVRCSPSNSNASVVPCCWTTCRHRTAVGHLALLALGIEKSQCCRCRSSASASWNDIFRKVLQDAMDYYFYVQQSLGDSYDIAWVLKYLKLPTDNANGASAFHGLRLSYRQYFVGVYSPPLPTGHTCYTCPDLWHVWFTS